MNISNESINLVNSVNLELTTLKKNMWHDAFYHFVKIDNPKEVILALKDISVGLLGSIIVASEGVNGMLAGTEEQLDNFQENLAKDPRFTKKFTAIDYKRSECRSIPFNRLKIKSKNEIVPLGIDNVDAISKTGTNTFPEDWQQLITQEDIVLIDNRNDFEYRLGHFKGAINPEVNNFRDFPKFIEQNLPKWQQESKRIAMYCTGGIRCEKTSAWLLEQGIESYQLAGGILNFFAKIPDAEKVWEGECFVFDNRVALDSKLRETSTTIEEVYNPVRDGNWRFERAQYLQHGPHLQHDSHLQHGSKENKKTLKKEAI